MTGPSLSVKPSCPRGGRAARPRSARRTSRRCPRPGAHLQVEAGDLAASACCAARSRARGRRRSAPRSTGAASARMPEPAERIDALVLRQRSRRDRRRGDAVEPSQPAMKSHSSSRSRPSWRKADHGQLGVEIVQAHVLDLEAGSSAGGHAAPSIRSSMTSCCAVDRDRAPAGQLAQRDAMAARRRSAARCRGARRPSRVAAARRRPASRAGRPSPCSSTPARTRALDVLAGCGSRARPIRCPRGAAGARAASPAGPAPMMPTCVRAMPTRPRLG